MSRKKNFCETVDNEMLRTPRYVSQIEFATGKIVQPVQENPKMRTCAVIPGRLEFYCLRTSIESMDQGPVRQIQSGKIHWPEKKERAEQRTTFIYSRSNHLWRFKAVSKLEQLLRVIVLARMSAAGSVVSSIAPYCSYPRPVDHAVVLAVAS